MASGLSLSVSFSLYFSSSFDAGVLLLFFYLFVCLVYINYTTASWRGRFMSNGLSYELDLGECLKFSSEPVAVFEFINTNIHLRFWSKARARHLLCSGSSLSAYQHCKWALFRQATSVMINNCIALILSSQQFWWEWSRSGHSGQGFQKVFDIFEDTWEI